MAILETEKLTKYFGGVAALKDLDVQVNEGEILGIIGPNGSGKTTIFNLVTGFLKPTGGKIIYGGKDITGLPSHKIAQLGVVRTFQQANVFKSETVLTNMLAAHHLRAKSSLFSALINRPSYVEEEQEIRESAEKLLQPIAAWKEAACDGLPHGHQKFLNVAMALACDPRILMLDEPGAGMNPEEAATMMDQVKALQARGITIILVEHDMKVVMGMCERIVVINMGTKIADGTPREIRENPQVVDAYLGSSCEGLN